MYSTTYCLICSKGNLEGTICDKPVHDARGHSIAHKNVQNENRHTLKIKRTLLFVVLPSSISFNSCAEGIDSILDIILCTISVALFYFFALLNNQPKIKASVNRTTSISIQYVVVREEEEEERLLISCFSVCFI